MATALDRAAARLNATLRRRAGLPVTLVDPAGGQHPVVADWAFQPVLIQQGEAVVSSTHVTLGLDLSVWPSSSPLPNTEWTVVIAVDGPDPEGRAGTWDIANVGKRGGFWLELELTNRRT